MAAVDLPPWRFALHARYLTGVQASPEGEPVYRRLVTPARTTYFTSPSGTSSMHEREPTRPSDRRAGTSGIWLNTPRASLLQ